MFSYMFDLLFKVASKKWYSKFASSLKINTSTLRNFSNSKNYKELYVVLCLGDKLAGLYKIDEKFVLDPTFLPINNLIYHGAIKDTEIEQLFYKIPNVFDNGDYANGYYSISMHVVLKLKSGYLYRIGHYRCPSYLKSIFSNHEKILKIDKKIIEVFHQLEYSLDEYNNKLFNTV